MDTQQIVLAKQLPVPWLGSSPFIAVAPPPSGVSMSGSWHGACVRALAAGPTRAGVIYEYARRQLAAAYEPWARRTGARKGISAQSAEDRGSEAVLGLLEGLALYRYISAVPLSAFLWRRVTGEKVAAAGMPLRVAGGFPLSLDRPLNPADPDSGTLGDRVPAAECDLPESRAVAGALAGALASALAALPGAQREALRLFSGLGGARPLSHEQIAQCLGLSSEGASQKLVRRAKDCIRKGFPDLAAYVSE